MDLLALSAQIIDSSEMSAEGGPMTRITNELSEVGEGVAVVESFSNSIVFDTGDGLVAFDASGARGGARVVAAINEWRDTRIDTLVYTHGHMDHVGGSGAFVAAAEERGEQRPNFVAHENVTPRLDRYQLTDGYNRAINGRQFGRVIRSGVDIGSDSPSFVGDDVVQPDVTYSDTTTIQVGGISLDLRHAKGETDDHTWGWIPQHKAICSGDFFIWAFPNAGNPQKVQRYPLEWAAAMRDMADQGAELFLPAHGLPIGGAARITQVLTEVAEALEYLVQTTLQLMNTGARLDDIVPQVTLDEDVLARPFLRPVYDEPEFVVRNIWRMYGGWYDGNPAHLKPAPDAVIAAEIAALAGGASVLADRAAELASADPRLACQLVEYASQAAPDDRRIHEIRAEIYTTRRSQELSLMAKGIFSSAAAESAAQAGQ